MRAPGLEQDARGVHALVGEGQRVGLDDIILLQLLQVPQALPHRVAASIERQRERAQRLLEVDDRGAIGVALEQAVEGQVQLQPRTRVELREVKIPIIYRAVRQRHAGDESEVRLQQAGRDGDLALAVLEAVNLVEHIQLALHGGGERGVLRRFQRQQAGPLQVLQHVIVERQLHAQGKPQSNFKLIQCGLVSLHRADVSALALEFLLLSLVHLEASAAVGLPLRFQEFADFHELQVVVLRVAHRVLALKQAVVGRDDVHGEGLLEQRKVAQPVNHVALGLVQRLRHDVRAGTAQQRLREIQGHDRGDIPVAAPSDKLQQVIGDARTDGAAALEQLLEARAGPAPDARIASGRACDASVQRGERALGEGVVRARERERAEIERFLAQLVSAVVGHGQGQRLVELHDRAPAAALVRIEQLFPADVLRLALRERRVDGEGVRLAEERLLLATENPVSVLVRLRVVFLPRGTAADQQQRQQEEHWRERPFARRPSRRPVRGCAGEAQKLSGLRDQNTAAGDQEREIDAELGR